MTARTIIRGAGDGRTVCYPAILFNHVEPLPPTIRAAYRPEVNEWNGTSSLQLVIEYWQPE